MVSEGRIKTIISCLVKVNINGKKNFKFSSRILDSRSFEKVSKIQCRFILAAAQGTEISRTIEFFFQGRILNNSKIETRNKYVNANNAATSI